MKANGFSSVSEMLVKGIACVNHEKVGAATIDSLKEVCRLNKLHSILVFSCFIYIKTNNNCFHLIWTICSTLVISRGLSFRPEKKGKENSFDGKIDANLPISVEKSSKKVKEVHNGSVDDNVPSKTVNLGHKRERKEEGFVDIPDCNGNAVVLTNEIGVQICEKKSKKLKCNKQ